MANYLRTKRIVVGDRGIIVKEFSVASQNRFAGYEKITEEVLLKESLSSEDYDWYVGNEEEIPLWVVKEIEKAITEVNVRPDWLPKLPEVIDNKPFRETTIGNKEVESMEKPVVVHKGDAPDSD